MTGETPAAARRRALLGPEVIEHIHAEVDASPEPEPGPWIDDLRRIFSTPAGPEPQAPATDTAA